MEPEWNRWCLHCCRWRLEAPVSHFSEPSAFITRWRRHQNLSSVWRSVGLFSFLCKLQQGWKDGSNVDRGSSDLSQVVEFDSDSSALNTHCLVWQLLERFFLLILLMLLFFKQQFYLFIYHYKKCQLLISLLSFLKIHFYHLAILVTHVLFHCARSAYIFEHILYT